MNTPSTPPESFEADGTARVGALWVYPVKSCAAVALTEAQVLTSGIDLDRAWMVVDAQGEFVSQREYPQMALIQPTLKTHEMVLRASGMLALHVAIDAVEAPCRVQIWDDNVAAYDMGDVAAQWVSMAITQGKTPLRLVRFDNEHPRLCSRKWTGAIEAHTEFSDGYPVLVCTQASVAVLNAQLARLGAAPVGIERFRPNIVLEELPAHEEDQLHEIKFSNGLVLRMVKPCVRCSIPDVDPKTAVSGSAVGQALAAYRSDSRMQGALTFGMNAVVVEEGSGSICTGDAVLYRYAV